jgi:hypothetical protein
MKKLVMAGVMLFVVGYNDVQGMETVPESGMACNHDRRLFTLEEKEEKLVHMCENLSRKLDSLAITLAILPSLSERVLGLERKLAAMARALSEESEEG